MKRILASLILALFVLLPVSAASPWNLIADKFIPSVVFIEVLNEQGEPLGFCSGYVINPSKKYIATAAHCDAPKVLVNGTQTYRMYKDARKDLAVFRASHLEGEFTPFVLAAKDPNVGDEVAAIGFGLALEKAMFRISHISIKGLDMPEFGLAGPFLMTDADFVGGQSGGPVVNQQGEVVAMVQFGYEGSGWGVGAEIIKDRIGRYFGE